MSYSIIAPFAEIFSVRKKRTVIDKAGLLTLVFLFMGRLAAGSPLSVEISPRKITVMTSVFPLMELARAVAGEEADVKLLLPPGAGVHTWQPRPSDLGKLYASDLFIYVGARLEPWADDILKSLSGRKLAVLEISRFLTLIEAGEEGHGPEAGHGVLDPHVWLDFEFDQTIVRRIQEAMSELVPSATTTFEANAKSYIENLKSLDELYQKELGSCPLRTFIVSGHAAFGYLSGLGLFQTREAFADCHRRTHCCFNCRQQYRLGLCSGEFLTR